MPLPGQAPLPGLEWGRATGRRTVLHVDVDRFVVSVELRRRPGLAGLPVVVGAHGDPTRRGVVSSASTEARAFGIDAGTPLRLAARRCPDAVFLPLDLRACRAAARELEAALRTFPGTWEIAGWDEAYLEPPAGTDPVELAEAIRARVLETTGLPCSVGAGESKLQARVASRLAKPGGVVALDAERWPEAVGPLGPELLPGVGPGRGRRLRALGIHTVSALAAADEALLAAAFGPSVGPALRRLARGEDDTPLVRRRPPSKSHGRAHTFDEDVESPAAVRETVLDLARAVARDLSRRHRHAVSVTVTLRFAPFETHSHTAATSRPSAETADLEDAALRALDRFELGRPVRMAGVRAELVPRAPRRTRTRPPRAQPRLVPYR